MKTGLRKLGTPAAAALTSTQFLGPTQTAAGTAVPPTPVIQTEPDLLSFLGLVEQAKPLLDQAGAGDGRAATTLAHSEGHHTVLSARTPSGGAELPNHFAGLPFVLADHGTELTGATIDVSKEGEDGEVGGSGLEGATRRLRLR